jgi:hypothetical protein
MNRKHVLGAATAALSFSLGCSTFAASLTVTPAVLPNKGDVEPDQTLVMGSAGPEFSDVLVSVAGTNSWDLVSDTSNQVLLIDIAAGAGQPSGTPMVMTGIGWNVSLATVGGSWLSEARFYFDDAIAPDLSGLFLRPSSTNAPGSASPSSGGVIDLSDNAIPDITLPNGILRIELYESYDDVPDAIDANWTAGNLTIRAEVVPEPASLSLLALGGLTALRRRR